MPGLSFKIPVTFTDRSLPKLSQVLTSDSFNRADGPLGTANGAHGGNPIAWAVDANITVAGNKWRAGGQSVNRSARLDVGTPSHTVTAKWLGGVGAGLIARYTDPSNYYRLDIAANGLALYRIKGGTSTPVRGPGPIAAIGDQISVSAPMGAPIDILLNGQIVMSYADPDPLTSGNSAGLRSAWTDETLFDDLIITN